MNWAGPDRALARTRARALAALGSGSGPRLGCEPHLPGDNHRQPPAGSQPASRAASQSVQSVTQLTNKSFRHLPKTPNQALPQPRPGPQLRRATRA